MITGTTMIMGITIITIMIGVELCLVRRRRPALGALEQTEPAARESLQ